MIDNIITAYLRNNKRLVVPDFGAFIHKEDGEIVFVEFLKKDDQVLSSLVRREFSLDETEARSAIDEYVLNIRRTVGATGKYIVDGLGTIRTDANGLYALAYDPRVRKDAAPQYVPAEEPAPTPESEPVPAMRVVSVREEEIVSPSVGDDILFEVREEIEETSDAGGMQTMKVVEFGVRDEEPAPAPEPPKPEEKKTFTLNDLYSIPAEDERGFERNPEPAHRPAAQTMHTHSEQPAQQQRPHSERPEARPQQGFGERPAAGQQPRRERPAENAQQRPRPVNYRKSAKSKVDWVMIIAIAVALFALGTMIVGMLSKSDPDIKPTRPQIENTVEPEIIDGDTVEEGAENEG